MSENALSRTCGTHASPDRAEDCGPGLDGFSGRFSCCKRDRPRIGVAGAVGIGEGSRVTPAEIIELARAANRGGRRGPPADYARFPEAVPADELADFSRRFLKADAHAHWPLTGRSHRCRPCPSTGQVPAPGDAEAASRHCSPAPASSATRATTSASARQGGAKVAPIDIAKTPKPSGTRFRKPALARDVPRRRTRDCFGAERERRRNAVFAPARDGAPGAQAGGLTRSRSRARTRSPVSGANRV
jgi:hypothetical protein